MGKQEGTEFSFPFDAVTDENGDEDRIYYSVNFADYFSRFLSDGIFPNPSNNLAVLSLKQNFTLTVKVGSALILGRNYILKEDLELMLNSANANYNRYDIIVARLDFVERYIRIFVKEGKAAPNPLKPELTRNADIYELKLAEVLIKSGTQAITQADILDTRLDSRVCGMVHSVVDHVDTTKLFQQYETYLNQKIAEWNATKVQQAQNFTTQMAQQASGFNLKMSEIDGWYASVKANIETLKTFDFDNISELKGCNKKTVFNSDGSITEKIIVTASNKTVATRVTKFNLDGSITVENKVYKDDGAIIMKQSTTTIAFGADGSIDEGVV